MENSSKCVFTPESILKHLCHVDLSLQYTSIHCHITKITILCGTWDVCQKKKKLNFHQTVSPGKRRSSSSGVISALVLHWRWTKTLKKPWLLSPNFHSVVVQIRVKCHFSSVEAMPRESSDPSQEKDSCLSFRLVYCPKMVAKMSSSLSSGRTLNEEDEQDSDCCFCEREAGRGRG